LASFRPLSETPVAVTVVVLATGYVVLPAADPIPTGVGADLLWRFRLVSLGGLAAMWGGMTLTMAVLCGGGRSR
jgi:hypothetical protein